MNWQPSNSVRELIAEFISNLITTTPEILGISEIIPGCTVVDVPAGATPKVVTATVHEFHQKVMWRGVPPALAVGNIVTVAHLREGNVYEIIGASGAGGSSGAWDAQFLTLAAHPQLTDERILTPRTWLAGTDGGAGGNYTLDFEPDNPILISGGAATEYATIQLAITAAGAGDMVLIPPGTYTEDITLKANVHVMGWGSRDEVTITGDEYVVTTAVNGFLENVTVAIVNPTAGGYKGAVHIVHNGLCWMKHITILVVSTVNLTAACGISSANDGGTGWLYIEDVIIETTNTVNGGTAVGMMVDDDYNIYANRFYIKCTGTGGAFEFAVTVLGDGDIVGTHGDIIVGGAAVSYGLYVSGAVTGSIQIYSVKHDTTATFGTITHLDGDRAGKWRNELITGTWTHSSPILGSGAPTLGSATDSEKWGRIYLAAFKDVLPDNEGNAYAGLMRRFVNKFGISNYDHHRGVGAVIPAGCVQTVNPATLWAPWSAGFWGWLLGTYYAHYPNHATLPAGLTMHSADPIANDQKLYARCHVTGSCHFGLWADNFDANRLYAIGNYIYRFDVEAYGNGPETLLYTQVATSVCTVGGVGAAATFAAWVNHAHTGPYGPFCPCGDGIVLMLLANLNTAPGRCYGYVVGEQTGASSFGNHILYDDAWPGASVYNARRMGTFQRVQGFPWSVWDWYYLS